MATDALASALKGQYHAGLKMLRQAVTECPEGVWTGDDPHPNAYWHVAYHVLFYTHLYLMPDDKAFEPWEKHREEYQFMGSVPWPPHDPPKLGVPYTPSEVLEYLDWMDGQVDAWVDALDLTAETCGFWWYEVPKLDHQLINLRHLQHHTGQLADRLRRGADVGVGWSARESSAR